MEWAFRWTETCKWLGPKARSRWRGARLTAEAGGVDTWMACDRQLNFIIWSHDSPLKGQRHNLVFDVCLTRLIANYKKAICSNAVIAACLSGVQYTSVTSRRWYNLQDGQQLPACGGITARMWFMLKPQWCRHNMQGWRNIWIHATWIISAPLYESICWKKREVKMGEK